MSTGKRGCAALAVITVAIVLTALAASGEMPNVHALGLSEALATATTPIGATAKTETTETAPATTEVTKTVTETVTVTATKTFYSIVTFTRTTATMIEYYGPMTFILLFVIMALTVALGFSLRRYRKLVSSSK